VRAVLLNANTPHTRGTVFSVFTLADDLGKGGGPFLASALILALGRQAVCHCPALRRGHTMVRS
jgi:hypothetical protein